MGENHDIIAVRAVVRGRVQGVWFRAWTAERARELGLGGWVRNRRNGTVEALFVGAEGAVEAMLAAMADGPPAARVDDVERVEVAPEESAGLGGFSTKRTV